MSLKGNIYRSTRLPGIHLQMYHWLYFYMAVTCFLHSHSSSPPIEMIQLACQLTFYVQTIHRQINYVSAQKAFLVSDSGSHCFWIKPVLATRTPRHSNTLADTPVEVTNGGGGTCCQAGWPDMAWNTPRKAAWRSRAVWLVRRLGSLIYLSLFSTRIPRLLLILLPHEFHSLGTEVISGEGNWGTCQKQRGHCQLHCSRKQFPFLHLRHTIRPHFWSPL